MVSFPSGKEDILEGFIINKLSNGYWNEYIGKDIVFLFKFENGNVKRYVLNKDNEKEVLDLCCKFADVEFLSIKEMILGNSFYKEKVKEIRLDE